MSPMIWATTGRQQVHYGLQMCSHTSRTGQSRNALGWSLACRRNARAPNRKGDCWSKSVSGHSPVAAWSCCSREVWNEWAPQGWKLFASGEGQRGPSAWAQQSQPCCASSQCQAGSPDCCCSFHHLRPRLSSCLSWYPTQSTSPISTLQLVTNSSLGLPPEILNFCSAHSSLWPCLPLICHSHLCPPRLTPAALWQFVFTLWISVKELPSSALPSTAILRGMPCSFQEKHVDTEPGTSYISYSLITLQNLLQGIINVWFLHIKYTLTSSHLPPSKA